MFQESSNLAAQFNRALSIQHSMLGPLGGLVLNYRELQCLDMAIDFLDEQVSSVITHHQLSNLHRSDVYSLKCWLRRSERRSHVRLDNSNHVVWPVDSFEDVRWLIIALEIGVNDKAVWAAAKEAADYEYDMLVGNDEASVLQDVAFNPSQLFCRFLEYYNDVVRCRPILLKQLRNL